MPKENYRESDHSSQFLVDPEEVCYRLVPPQYWNDVMEALGTSIELVHQSGPDRWGVRLAPDSIMLKVGPHEVLQIGTWERPFHLIVDTEIVPVELRRLSELWFSEDRDWYGNPGASGYYSSNPGSEACNMPLERVKDIYQALLEAHSKVITRAATKRRHPSTLRTHSPELVLFVANALGKSLPQPAYFETSSPDSPPLTAEELRSEDPETMLDEREEARINEAEIPATEKEQLIKARRGQGMFRDRVEAIETTCRMTGVNGTRFLIASHIKPWRASDNTEKLDGSNGLLLSPHVDKLFDKGWISFSDDGKVLCANDDIRRLMILWGLNPDKNVGAFNPEQSKYLAYHRETIYKA